METSKRPREDGAADGEAARRARKQSRFGDAVDKVVPPVPVTGPTAAAAIAAALSAKLQAQQQQQQQQQAVAVPPALPLPVAAKPSNGVHAAGAPGAAAAGAPADVAAKAARFAALQAQIQASLANAGSLLRQTEGAAAAISAASGAVKPASSAVTAAERKARDFTIRLDDQGRQVDSEGRVVKMGPVQTLKVNRQKAENPYLSMAPGSGAVEDPSLRHRLARAQKSLQFVEPGRYVKLADQQRHREERQFLRGLAEGRANRPEQLEEVAAPAAAAAAEAAAAAAAAPAAVKAAPPPPPSRHAKDPVPVMEWWDEAFVDRGLRERRARGEAAPAECTTEALYDGASAERARTLGYVQHPAVAAPAAPEAAALPVHLTAKERKRVRRQARQEREREKQDMVALGLMPAPEPKMKLSNFMKVLGEQAVADPSKVERLVMEQVHARQMKHEMANAARQLTPEERRAKKAKRLREDTATEVHVAVFRVAASALDDPRRRFKVDKNAQQWYLTGGVLMCKAAGIAAIVAEGGPKGIKAYSGLMLRRIQWGSGGDDGDDSDDDEGEDAAGGAAAAGADMDVASSGGGGSSISGFSGAPCQLVWQGVVKQRAFNAFRFQECTSAETARKVMAQRHVAHYWDLCLRAAEGGKAAVPGLGL